MKMRSSLSILAILISTACGVPVRAQEISIPDTGLNAAVREALQKPDGVLTESDLLNLTELYANNRNITNVEGLQAARNLMVLELQDNRLINLNFPSLTRLTYLDLGGNQLTNVSFPTGLTNLKTLGLASNALTRLTLPADLTNLVYLELRVNQLTNLDLPPRLGNLNVLDLEMNQLANLNLPAGLTNLSVFGLQQNRLTSLTLPLDMTDLTSLLLTGNPITTFVLSEVEATNLAATVVEIKNQGASVFTYPLTIQLLRPRELTGALQFGITGPPGAYSVSASSDFSTWTEVGIASNKLGSVSFVDESSHLFPRRFYEARLQTPPANRGFVPPNSQ